MRILHTADWHLGRSLHGRSLLEDQHHALAAVVRVVQSEMPDVVLVAGDVFDRAVPPPEAVRLLDDALSEIVLGLGVPVVLIAGNHDAAERLAFGARLMAERGLHIAPPLGGVPVAIPFEDRHGPVEIVPLPYAEPGACCAAIGIDTLDHDGAMAAMCAAVRAARAAPRSVLVAHAFVTGGTASQSERPLGVGGAGTVSAACFDGFDYVALGHLHRPQQPWPRGRYAGSLLKLGKDEYAHAKSLSLVELGRDGTPEVASIELVPRRDLRVIAGHFDALLQAPANGRDDYIFAQITDDAPVFDAAQRLRAVYPNLLNVEHAARPITDGGEFAGADPRQLPVGDLFAAFMAAVGAGAMNDDEQQDLAAAIARAEREG